jgi:hypothetical protein
MSGSLPTQKNDLAFGEANEMTTHEVLEAFLDTTLERKGGYAVFDFENPTKTIFVELKSRRIKHDTYDTAIIGLNKIAFCDQVEGVQYWIAFCYVDGIYVIKFDKEVFDGFEVRHNYLRGARSDVYNKPQSVVMIPTNLLVKVNPNELLAKNEIVEEAPKNEIVNGGAGSE